MNTTQRKLDPQLARILRAGSARAETTNLSGKKKIPGKWGHRVPSMPTFKALEKQGEEQ